jgi:fumarate reductase flavoprotein subunit
MKKSKIGQGIIALLLTAGLALFGCARTEEAALTLDVDIVIVGAGGAGMTAAVQAYQDGATNIVIVEQMPFVGGNTLLATGGLNAANTRYQPAGSDSVELFMADTIAGGRINDPALVRIMAEYSAAAVYWLNDLGAGLTDITRSGGASVPRVHRPVGGPASGPFIVRALYQAVQNANIPIMLNTRVTEILVAGNGNATGIRAIGPNGETIVIRASAVILASGGFGANPQMLVSLDPTLDGFGTTNHVGASGDVILYAQAIGAALVDMTEIQTHPTVEPNTNIMYTESVRGEGGILVNREGARFVNELDTREVVSEATLAQTGDLAFLVWDGRIRQTLGVIESYINAGIVQRANTPRELAVLIGVDPDNFEQAINRYNAAVTAGSDQDWGRTASMHRLDGPGFYAGITRPAVHHTMGGVMINTNTEVLRQNGSVITGLFAAGEVTGGVHGDNRLGGNALADITVFGRIAGTNAVTFVRNTAGLTTPMPALAVSGATPVATAATGQFTNGIFEGTAMGYGGYLSVRVTVVNGNIVNIEMFNHRETPIIYTAAERGVVDAIISAQNTNVDTVTGATVTSIGIIQAVNLALGN